MDANKDLMNLYKRLPIAFDRGEGVWLWDTEGNQYLDALSGIAVTGLGHSNPKVVEAIQTQAAKLLHTSNLYQITHQETLAKTLCRLTGLNQAFFCNSGAEAVEAAMKLARLYAHTKEIKNPHIIVMQGSFHGRTLATISAGGSQKNKEGFEPLLPGFIQVPYNDIQSIHEAASKNNEIIGILVEPVQGENGIIVPDKEYLKNLRALCDDKKWLLILDEVQTGMARTGSFFEYQSHFILPDIISIAKGLANGVPIGACLAKEEIANVFKPGNHGSTFGGNPLACAAGIATVKEIEEKKLWENAKKQGAFLLEGLQKKLKDHPHVKAIRGKGLMVGVELDMPCREILLLALKKRILFSVSNEKIIRLLPPLIITQEQVQKIIDIIPELVSEFTQK